MAAAIRAQFRRLPRSAMHTSRSFFVSGHVQQIFLGLPSGPMGAPPADAAGAGADGIGTAASFDADPPMAAVCKGWSVRSTWGDAKTLWVRWEGVGRWVDDVDVCGWMDDTAAVAGAVEGYGSSDGVLRAGW